MTFITEKLQFDEKFPHPNMVGEFDFEEDEFEGIPTAEAIKSFLHQSLLDFSKELEVRVEGLKTPRENCITGFPCEFENRAYDEALSVIRELTK